jgi:amino acid adenylation domain-containing protein
MKYNILDYFHNTVKKAPNKVAIIEGDNHITFQDLELKTKILAIYLLSNLDEKNKPIAVYLPKSIQSVIANIAITYSANIYMHLDIKNPSERILNILNLIQPRIIITNSIYLNDLANLPNYFQIVNIDEINFDERIDTNILLQRLDSIIDTDPYCIINTSGSTGTPKGVVLNHKSFIDFVEVSNSIFKFSNDEIIGSLSPVVFDIWSFELCMLMANSSTIVLLPAELAAFPIKIINILEDKKVSFIFWVPTIMVNIANMKLLDNVSITSLKTIWFAGEVFPTKQFNYWKSKLTNTLFANLYGPIEITLDCTYFIVNRDIPDEKPLPIGIPYKNTDILILNENNELVKNGEDGELCVRGTSLAMGYYNNPEKTSLAFVQNPLNNSYPELVYKTGDIVNYNEFGEIEFKGRKDSLIKHLGYRIELGEIEHILVNKIKLVKNACAAYDSKKKEIVLFYESEIDILNTDFRNALAMIVPKYMMPSKFKRFNELPRNTNGKIDRNFFKNYVNK